MTDLLATIARDAQSVDKGEVLVFQSLPQVAATGLFDPATTTQAVASTLVDLASVDLSVAFGSWAQRMTIEYLAAADTVYAQAVLPDLVSAARPGITGMASAFKTLAGCGTPDLVATPATGGWVLNGQLKWASNVLDQAQLVTAARTEAGEDLILSLDLGAEGISIGTPFGLLGLNATASTSISFQDVFLPEEQVLSTDLKSFLTPIRPIFTVFQTALCVGVAKAAIQHTQNKVAEPDKPGFVNVNAIFAQDAKEVAGDVEKLEADLYAVIERIEANAVDKREVLTLRLQAAEVATAATALEVRVSGGAGYAKHSPASRRFREASFIPVQSPSEAQLRWELAQL